MNNLAILSVVSIVFLAGCVGQPVSEVEMRNPDITVSSQAIQNNQIAIDSLYLDKPGYVVIHQDADGKPGPVIGNSELLSGEVTNLKVTIDAAKAGTRVFAMLHYDDDGDGVYGFPDEDKPVVLEGNVIVKPVGIIQPETTQQAEETPMEETTVTETTQVKEFTIETDDSGYYMDGKITSISVNSGDTVKITFKVRTSNVAFGGLEFRSTMLNIDTPDVSPGDSTTIEFTADNSGTITSYWPSSNRVKANLQVNVV